MLLKKFPSIKHRSEKTTGILFSAMNLLFFLRLGWVLFSSDPDRGAALILGTALLVQILFIITGLNKALFGKILELIHRTGFPFILFFSFIISKRLLKPILLEQTAWIRSEIGTWYLALFLFLAAVILINFLRDLYSRAAEGLPGSAGDRSKSKFVEIVHYLVMLMMIGYWIYTQAINPLPIYSNYDPEFTYMLNSLTPFKDLELYGRMDHPGTLLQIAGSMIAILLSPLSVANQGYPFQYHINHPGAFIYSARFLLLMLNILTVRVIYKYFKNPNTWAASLAGAGAIIVYFSTHNDSYLYLVNWSPNSFNFAAGTFVLATLYLILTRGKYTDLRTLWMVSLAAGMAATIHVYMISLILCTITAVFFTSLLEGKRWKDILKYSGLSALGAAAGYITATLVILPYYESFLVWIIKVLSHQGTYGSGTAGFVTLANFTDNMLKLWKNNPALFIFWLLSVLAFIILFFIQRKKKQLDAPVWAFIIGINLQIIALLIIFGKQPGHRYLLSVAAVFPLVLILLSRLLSTGGRSAAAVFGAIFSALTILLFANFTRSIINHQDSQEYYLKYQAEVDTFKRSLEEQSGFEAGEITYHWTYNTLSSCYSLWLGNDFSKTRFTDEISAICSQDLQYDVWKYSPEELENLRDENRLNILIVNERNFDLFNEIDYIEKVESGIHNLGFILVR